MMDPREELEMLRAKKARRAELEARAGGAMQPASTATVPPPAEEDQSVAGGNFSLPNVMSGIKDFGGGLNAAWNSSARGLAGMLPDSVRRVADKLDELTVGKATEENSVPPDSAMGTAGNLTGHVGLTLAPGAGVLKAANLVDKGLKLTRVAKLATPAVIGTDLAGNAAISAAMEPGNREDAALWGAGGAGAGRVAGRVLGGGLRESVSPQAKTLIDAGVDITPGQAVSGPQASTMARLLRGTEDKLTSVPILGDVIKRGKADAMESFNLEKINAALAPTGKRVKVGGVEGLAEAKAAASSHYDTSLPYIKVEPTKALRNIEDAIDAAKKDVPFFDSTHQAKIDDYVDRFVKPLFEDAANKGVEISGQVAKKLDSDIGDLARKFSTGGLGHEPIGDALFKVQEALRTSMRGTTSGSRQALREADAAFAKLLPIQEAGRRTASGFFTPRQLAEQLHRAGSKVDDVTNAAKQILPDTVADTGTAGRGILAHLLRPTGAGAGVAAGSALAGFGAPAVAAAAAAALYSKTGLKAATQGVHPVIEALRNRMGAGRIAGKAGPMKPTQYNPQEIEDIIRNLSGRTITAANLE